MEGKKILRIVFIFISILVTLFLIFIIGLWAYKERTSVTESTDSSAGSTGLIDPYLYDKGSPEVIVPSDVVTSDGLTIEDKSIIKTGEISIAVDNIDTTMESIISIRNEYGATTTNLNDSGNGKDRVISLSIKVEESKFEELYNKLKELDGEYLGSSIAESDVTNTVIDLQARLQNYEGVETQLLSILETAKTVEDTLAVYKELNGVRLNIEMVETALKNIGNQTEYSFIYMNISQSSTGAEISDEEWKPSGIFNDAIRALVSFAKFFGSTLIWLVVFIPVIALIVVPVIIIQKRVRK